MRLKGGLLEVQVRLPAEVTSAKQLGNTSATSVSRIKWHRTARAGFLTVHELLEPLSGFEAYLDDNQPHEVRVERSTEKASSTGLHLKGTCKTQQIAGDYFAAMPTRDKNSDAVVRINI